MTPSSSEQASSAAPEPREAPQDAADNALHPSSRSGGLSGPLPGTPEDLRKIRERILNVVGHELLTPVTTIRGLADAVSEGDAQTRERLAPLLQRNARRLERLVNDLLLAAGVDTVLPVAEPTSIAVRTLVTHAWGTDADEPFTLEVPDDLCVHMDADAAHRALEHVLVNARTYGTAPPTVTARQEGRDVELTIDSPGAPLHPEEVRLATEPFYRGEHAVMTAAGLGLGLPVARALLRHAGGQLAVAARPGGGLVTRLVMPAGEVEG